MVILDAELKVVFVMKAGRGAAESIEILEQFRSGFLVVKDSGLLERARRFGPIGVAGMRIQKPRLPAGGFDLLAQFRGSVPGAGVDESRQVFGQAMTGPTFLYLLAGHLP